MIMLVHQEQHSDLQLIQPQETSSSTDTYIKGNKICFNT